MQYNDMIVIVLGAGASAPSGLPVMASFMNVARRRSQPAKGRIKESYDVMLAFWERCRSSNWALQRHWDNIEELYTQADLIRLSKASVELIGSEWSGEDLCKHISWCIWDVYRAYDGDMRPWHGVMQQIFAGGFRPAVITTNYDVLVETCLTDSRFKPYYPAFEPTGAVLQESDTHWRDVIPPHFDIPSSGDVFIPIVKLHGSVNWLQNQVDGQWLAVPTVKAVHDSRAQKGCLFDRDEIIARCVQKAGEKKWESAYPAIIPPMLGKGSNANVISAHWQCAVAFLQRARQVWVIGYSFPQTDTFMLRLLTEGLYNNSDFERLVIIDKQSREDWEGRLNAMLDPVFGRYNFGFRTYNSAAAINRMNTYPIGQWQQNVEGA